MGVCIYSWPQWYIYIWWALYELAAHNDISVPILVSTMSVAAADTRNTALQIVKHTECCKSIVRARSGVNLSRPHFLPTGRPATVGVGCPVMLCVRVPDYYNALSECHTQCMVVLQGNQEVHCSLKRCKIVSNKVGWRLWNIVAKGGGGRPLPLALASSP